MADRPRPDTAHNSSHPADRVSSEVDGASLQPTVDPVAERPLITLADLIREHTAPLYRYAFRLTGQSSDAEDLVQQTFLVAQQKLHQLREAERASAWLFAVLRSCFLRTRRKRMPLVDEEHFPLDSVADQPAGESSDAWIDREALQGALSDMPDEFKLVVLMFYFEDLSYKEIATQLDVPIGTVMSRLSRGKAHLRRRLTESSPTAISGDPVKHGNLPDKF
jgi:RNA polymerase sigma-70 factor (ECF subfamily)